MVGKEGWEGKVSGVHTGFGFVSQLFSQPNCKMPQNQSQNIYFSKFPGGHAPDPRPP